MVRMKFRRENKKVNLSKKYKEGKVVEDYDHPTPVGIRLIEEYI